MPARSTTTNRRTALLLGLIALVGAFGCGEFPQSSLHPEGDFARLIDDLFTMIFWWAVLVFVVVEGLLIYVVFRYRDRGDGERPEPVHGNTLLEIAWTLAPAIILVFIAIPTMQTIWQVDNPTADENPLRVNVVANQWWWEFTYPDLGVETANELHIPAGRTVDLRLVSNDVIHSFWLPRVAGKRDVFPDRETHLWFRADSAGVYPGQCAEFCGLSHALMGMLLVVQDSSEFASWVEEQRTPAREPETALARRGQEIFTNSVCITCHTVEGTVARGEIGPDLTHMGSRRTIAAGILTNTPENMTMWLEDPQAVKPGNLMRIPDLDPDDIEALVAYLNSLE